MYRTYRHLYRGKVEIISIGVGAGKLRLPRGVSLGVDTLLLAAIATIIIGLPLGRIVKWSIPAVPYAGIITLLIPPVTGILIAFGASKFDPQGKSVIRWLRDVLGFLFFPKRSDGWSHAKKVKQLRLDAHYYAVEHQKSSSVPVRGRGHSLTLYRPLHVRINKRNQEWLVSRSGGQLLQPGRYELVDGEFVSANQPVIRRRRNKED